MDLVHEYLKLGLRFDRVVQGYVDAYTGPAALRAEVADEPAPDPADLSRQAAALSAQVADSDLAPARIGFITAHLDALAVGGRRLAGTEMSFVDEVRSYFQVDIAPVPTDVFAAAHDEISSLLGGSGDLMGRWTAFREADTCPVELVESAVRRLAAALRERVAGPVGLPAAEHIDFEIATDAAWSGFNYYLGGYRSRVAVNAGVGHRISQLPVLTAHECYPGHHTEHCRKEDLLIERGGELEHSVFLVNTPQCVMAEGLGDLALAAAIGPGWATWAQEVLQGIGPAFEPELVEALEVACRPLNSVRQNAAIMLHDQGVDETGVLDHLQRWGLVSESRARQMLRFMSDPLWRAYTSTYVEGERLLRPWLAARPSGQSAMHRFQRLLDEPLTPAMIQAEMAATTRTG